MDKISWSLVLLRSSLVLDVVSLPGVSVTELIAGQILFGVE